MNKILEEKLKKIKVLAMDVDGVLTNGDIIINADGSETKIFDVQDGYAIVLFQRQGFKTAIISARSAAAVTYRAKDLKIDKVYQDARIKIDALHAILNEFKVTIDEVCFIGDDLPDLNVIKAVGVGVTVPNGAPEVKKAADHITQNPGGRGAVRELIELILKTQGKWENVLNSL